MSILLRETTIMLAHTLERLFGVKRCCKLPVVDEHVLNTHPTPHNHTSTINKMLPKLTRHEAQSRV
jgi:hypothetical protein